MCIHPSPHSIRDSTEGATQRARHSTEGAELRLRVGANKFTQDLIVFFKFTSEISRVRQYRRNTREQTTTFYRTGTAAVSNRHSFFYVILELQVYA